MNFASKELITPSDLDSAKVAQDVEGPMREYLTTKLGMTVDSNEYKYMQSEILGYIQTLMNVLRTEITEVAKMGSPKGSDAAERTARRKAKQLQNCLAAHRTGFGFHHWGCYGLTKEQKTAARKLIQLKDSEVFVGKVFKAIGNYDNALWAVVSTFTLGLGLATMYGVSPNAALEKLNAGHVGDAARALTNGLKKKLKHFLDVDKATDKATMTTQETQRLRDQIQVLEGKVKNLDAQADYTWGSGLRWYVKSAAKLAVAFGFYDRVIVPWLYKQAD